MSWGDRLRSFFILAVLLTSHAGAFTVILKNGKTLEGTLLSEERETLRFRDIDGVQYTLKKEALNIPAMIKANSGARSSPDPKPEVRIRETTILHSTGPTLAEIARENLRNRTGSTPVLRNTWPRELLPSWPKTNPELPEWIARTEADFRRLAARCRAAGASPSAKHSYRQDTYIVEGKQVSVSGYWADPDEVESARRICSEAMLLEKALNLARADLEQLRLDETQEFIPSR